MDGECGMLAESRQMASWAQGTEFGLAGEKIIHLRSKRSNYFRISLLCEHEDFLFRHHVSHGCDQHHTQQRERTRKIDRRSEGGASSTRPSVRVE